MPITATTPQPHPTFTPPHPAVLQEQIKLTVQLAGPLSQLQDAARRIAEVSRECKLEVDTGWLVGWLVGGLL